VGNEGAVGRGGGYQAWELNGPLRAAVLFLQVSCANVCTADDGQ
jgi:hypothetical protein